MVFGSVLSYIRLTLTLYLLINIKDTNSKILQLKNLCPGIQGYQGYQELSVIDKSKNTNSTPHFVLLTNLLSTLTLQLRDLCLGNKDTNSLLIQGALVQMCIPQDKLTYTSKALWEAQRLSKDDYMRYHLPYDIRPRIIPFGIRKRQMKHQYRRSRSGQNLFHHIAIISRRFKDTPTCIQNQTLRQGNLIYPNLQTLKPNGIISLSHINARSVCNKTLELQTYITERSIDLCAITETWLRPDDQVTLPDITPSGYKALSKLRLKGRGGGIALIYKKDIPIKEIDISIEFQTIELAYYKVKVPSKVLDLLIIY